MDQENDRGLSRYSTWSLMSCIDGSCIALFPVWDVLLCYDIRCCCRCPVNIISYMKDALMFTGLLRRCLCNDVSFEAKGFLWWVEGRNWRCRTPSGLLGCFSNGGETFLFVSFRSNVCIQECVAGCLLACGAAEEGRTSWCCPWWWHEPLVVVKISWYFFWE